MIASKHKTHKSHTTDHETAEDIHKLARHYGRKLRNSLDEGGQDIGQFVESVTDKIHEKPVQAALIGLGVGFLVGIFFQRR